MSNGTLEGEEMEKEVVVVEEEEEEEDLFFFFFSFFRSLFSLFARVFRILLPPRFLRFGSFSCSVFPFPPSVFFRRREEAGDFVTSLSIFLYV